MNIKKTSNLLLNFAARRLAEIFGIVIFVSGATLLIALISYSPEDPNFIFPENTEIKNLLGFKGSYISDLFFQSLGLISYLISFTFIITGIITVKIKDF
ncbi:DNA translocase FtsK 4TM domain-containing protein, partial [Candidatus Pelagibacter sp.]|nr:DNA translocase FtsK 4TM domain-containing protein [Candidatus Pelagibacter sp.]